MTQSVTKTEVTKNSRISLDTWAVLVALLAAVAIRTGIISRVPW